MPFKPHYLLVSLTLCWFVALQAAFPMNGCAACQKCRCIRTSSAFISPRQFHRIEILPPGAHCRQTEIIVTKKDKATVCVTPDARWINKVIAKLQRTNKKKRSAELPISTTIE
ncbi:C-X-C motif chemokine 13-like isoform X1 [Salvelinus alpinus]|uniref:C-X-C motif chemokine 13-like isoform X1 n=1 Tax=Salvelinus alpinus TaxID=8036 RepID=UPI0039FC813B